MYLGLLIVNWTRREEKQLTYNSVMQVNNVKTPIPSYSVDAVSKPYSNFQMHFGNKQQTSEVQGNCNHQ